MNEFPSPGQLRGWGPYILIQSAARIPDAISQQSFVVSLAFFG